MISFGQRIKSAGCNWEKIEKYMAGILILFGIAVIFFRFGKVPGGMQQDEAFAGYNAWSLLHYGMDSEGYANPVYFVTWGSGMSALNTYLMMPLMALFGCHDWVVRLPQALMGCISLPVFYLILKRLYTQRIALLGLFLLAVSPWHIMSSRWGLDCNLAPAFLLLGLYFFLLGLEKSRIFLLSAFFYGLSLYCYAILWLIVPLTLLLFLLYCFFFHRSSLDRFLGLSGVVLFLMALPLLLFLAVNQNLIPEIRTGWISIPHLTSYRISEITHYRWKEHLKALMLLLVTGNDGTIWNTMEPFGLYYPYSIFLAGIGLFAEIVRVIRKLIRKQFEPGGLILLHLGAVLLVGTLLMAIDATKINAIHMLVTTFTALGIMYLVKGIKILIPSGVGSLQILALRFGLIFVLLFCFTFYLISFIGFEKEYNTTYAEQIGTSFQSDAGEAVRTLVSVKGNKTAYLDGDFYFPKFLYYLQYPTDQFVKDHIYINPQDYYRQAKRIGSYYWGMDLAHLDKTSVYLLKKSDAQTFVQNGFQVKDFQEYCVAYTD